MINIRIPLNTLNRRRNGFTTMNEKRTKEKIEKNNSNSNRRVYTLYTTRIYDILEEEDPAINFADG